MGSPEKSSGRRLEKGQFSAEAVEFALKKSHGHRRQVCRRCHCSVRHFGRQVQHADRWHHKDCSVFDADPNVPALKNVLDFANAAISAVQYSVPALAGQVNVLIEAGEIMRTGGAKAAQPSTG